MNDRRSRSTVAVLGAGLVGRSLANRLAQAGHPVVLGSRDPRNVEASELPARVSVAEHAEAAGSADAVVITVPGAAVAELAAHVAKAIDSKPVIDATNKIGAARLNGLPELTAAGAVGYRAFNSVGWEQMAQPVFSGTVSDMFYAGPDGPTRTVVHDLITAVGFRPVWVGDGAQALTAVDNLLALWYSVAVGQGWGRRLGFRLLTGADDVS